MVFSTFVLGSRSIDKNQGHSKANAHIVLLSSWAIKRQSSNRVKFPIVKWSKHGCLVITLLEIKRATRVDTILQCGDIHPQPGPDTSKSNTNEGKAARLAKATKYATIAHLNGRSMVSRENFHLVKQTILSNEYNIFTISETWLDPSTTDTDIQISGYILFRQDRGTHKNGGGVVVYVKGTYKASVIKELSTVSDCNFQQLWLKVQCKKLKSFLLCTVHRPPNSPITFFEDIEKTFVDFYCWGWKLS